MSERGCQSPAAPPPPQFWPVPPSPASKYEFAPPPPAQGGTGGGVWPPVPEAAPPAGGTDAALKAPDQPPPPGPAAQPSLVRRHRRGSRTRCRGRRRPRGHGARFHRPAARPASSRSHPAAPGVRPANQVPPPARWAPPRIDPSQRWAPRADLQTADSAPIRHVQVEEVVKRRREPAEIGWRKAVYACTGGLVNLGAGPRERRLRDCKARVTSNIPGNYQIASVLGQRRGRQDPGDRRCGRRVRR